MRLSKIYTKTGDKGLTRLASGQKISKSDQRLASYGEIDELNSFVGLLADTVTQHNIDSHIHRKLIELQHRLFDIGGELSTPADFLDPTRQPLVSEADTAALERDMDEWNESLEPLQNFVLPGGHVVNSHCHVCRAICRRAERCLVALSSREEIRPELLAFVNRLSDWFFVLARRLSQLVESPEVLWQQNPNR